MKPFELRLAEHHARNARHLRNLKNLVADNARFSRISQAEQSLLERQIGYMQALNDVLESRMVLHNIPL